MEMKGIYPKLPRAPSIDDQGQGYRLEKKKKKRNSIILEKEVVTRESFSKKYFRAVPQPDGG